MNLFVLGWKYIRANALNTSLNVILLAFGLSIILVLMIISDQLEKQITRNAKGINLVVGAKGSPLQLILCNVYHADFPTGNISLEEAIALSKNSLIKRAVPMALGDSYRNFRLVGTSKDYISLFNAQFKEGAIWQNNMEVVLGAKVARTLQLKIDDTFSSEHGMQTGGFTHDESPFRVTGILNRTNTVLDNLIITNVNSIWDAHSHHESDEHELEADSMITELGITFHADDLAEKEITSLLVTYAGPMGAVQLPRLINKKTNMQAAAPAFETARLFTLMGVGIEVVNGFAYLIIIISGLSIFIALYNSMKERKYDLAIMRSMGASRMLLFSHIILEGLIISLFGAILGFVLSHGAVEFIGSFVIETSSQTYLTGFTFIMSEITVVGISFAIGILAATIPAISAYSTDISKILSEG